MDIRTGYVEETICEFEKSTLPEQEKEYFFPLTLTNNISKKLKRVSFEILKLVDNLNNDEECIKIIQKTIEQNRNGSFIRLDPYIFVKGYPNSVNYVVDYFNSLLASYVSYTNLYYKGKKVQGLEKEKYFSKKLKKEYDVITAIFLIKKNIISVDILKILDINKEEAKQILSNYRFTNYVYFEGDNIKQEKRELLGKIINDINTNKFTMKMLTKKYNIKENYIILLLKEIKDKEASEKILKKLNDNETEYTCYCKNLFDEIITYIPNDESSENEYFTILDLYSISEVNIYDFRDFVRYHIECGRGKNSLMKLFEQEISLATDNIERIVNKSHTIKIDNKQYQMDENVTSDLINIFNENNIPVIEELLYIAFRRHIKGIDILPYKKKNRNRDK